MESENNIYTVTYTYETHYSHYHLPTASTYTRIILAKTFKERDIIFSVLCKVDICSYNTLLRAAMWVPTSEEVRILETYAHKDEHGRVIKKIYDVKRGRTKIESVVFKTAFTGSKGFPSKWEQGVLGRFIKDRV